MSLQRQIHEITGIARSALCGERLDCFSIEERFGWAADRRTKREEDWAYSLLGIFDVFIPAIYGEGKANSTRRLRNEIAGRAGERQDRRRVFDVPMDANKNYVLRPELEKRLLDALRFGQDATSARVALWGLGGSGKTQLALRFITQHQASHPLVFWLNGDTWAKPLSGFGRLLRLAGVTRPAMSDEAEMASEWLQQNTGWFLVIDNLDDGAVLHRLHQDVLRSNMQGTILITSRNDEVRSQWNTLEVSNMTEDESTALVRAIAGSEHAEDKATASLLADLGHLPLAVDQAASYICASRLSVAKYHELYTMAKSTYLEMYPSTSYNVVGRHNVMTTWNMSFNEVAKTHPQAANLLLLMSLLEADDIPVTILKSCVGGQYFWSPAGEFERVPDPDGGWIPAELKEVLGGEPNLVDAWRQLQRFGFVKYQTKSESLYLHPLVQYWACRRLEKDPDTDLRRKLVVCLLGLVSAGFEKQDLLPPLPAWQEWSSRTISIEERKLNVWPWRKYPRLIPHAQRCILLATEQVNGRGRWGLGGGLTMAHISLPLLQVLEYSSFGIMSEDYKNSTALIDACLSACTSGWPGMDHRHDPLPLWAGILFRHRRSGLCPCREKSELQGKPVISPRQNYIARETKGIMTLLQSCELCIRSPFLKPTVSPWEPGTCLVCQKTSQLAQRVSTLWPTTPNILTPAPSLTKAWIWQYWDTVSEYFDVRAASIYPVYRHHLAAQPTRAVEIARSRKVRTAFEALCGNLSEECRRVSYFLALELGQKDNGRDEMVSLLQPYVAQSVATPDVSWSHERCIIEYISGLIKTSRDSEATDCLRQISVAYKMAGLVVPAVCRGSLPVLRQSIQDVRRQDLACVKKQSINKHANMPSHSRTRVVLLVRCAIRRYRYSSRHFVEGLEHSKQRPSHA